MQKNIPKVKFLLPTAKQEAGWLFYFIRPNNSGWDWSNEIYKKHPQLKNAKNFKQCLEYTKKKLQKNKIELAKTQKKFQKKWDKIGPEYLDTISLYFDISLPKNKIIKAYISINPICPRFIKKSSFNVRYDDEKYLIPTTFHEIMHFFYFKKWKKVFPKSNPKEFDAPYLIWRLSEIITPIILNNYPKIRKMLNHPTCGYKEFQKIKITGIPLNIYFKRIYINHLKNNSSFSDFLKELWKKGKENKKIIEKI